MELATVLKKLTKRTLQVADNGSMVVAVQFPQKQRCEKCNGNHSKLTCWMNDQECFKCRKFGHIAKFCKDEQRLMTAEPPRQSTKRFAAVGRQGCAFCEEESLKMCDCPRFLSLLSKCNWCGDANHPSHQCPQKPKQQEDKSLGNVTNLMQVKKFRSTGAAYYVDICRREKY